MFAMSTCWLYTDIKVSLDQFKTKYRWTQGELLLIPWVMVQTACHRNTFVNNSLAIYRGTFTVLDCYRTLHIQEILECKVHSVLCSLIQPITHTRQGKNIVRESTMAVEQYMLGFVSKQYIELHIWNKPRRAERDNTLA